MKNSSLKKIFLIIFALKFCFVFADTNDVTFFKGNVKASFYADKFNGMSTASGEIFDNSKMTAAHRKLPFGTLVRVVNKKNGKSVVVKINDRGPWIDDREIDVSKAAAEQLGFTEDGICYVDLALVDESYVENSVKGDSSQTVIVNGRKVETLGTIVAVENNTEKEAVSYKADSNADSGLWVIQVGSFKNDVNAVKMLEKLMNIGLDPVVEKSADGKYSRIVLTNLSAVELENTKQILTSKGLNNFWVHKK